MNNQTALAGEQEPERLLQSAASPFARAVLESGRRTTSSPARQAQVLAALGAAGALSATSKASWAMAAAWKKTLAIGAIACGGAGGVLAYQAVHVEQSAEPSVPRLGVAAQPGAATLPVSDVPNAHRTALLSTALLSDAQLSDAQLSDAKSSPGQKLNTAPEAKRAEQVEQAPRQPVPAKKKPAVRQAATTKGKSATGSSETPASEPAASLAEEVASLDQVRSLIRNGQPSQALVSLSRHNRAFPQAHLRLEAEVLRIEALAESGQRGEAARRANRILHRSPNSVVAARLRRFSNNP